MSKLQTSTDWVHLTFVLVTPVVPVPDTFLEAVPVPNSGFFAEVVSLMRLAAPRFVRNQDVVSRRIDGELIIVPVRRGVGDMNSLYTLNSVGSVLWEFMAEGHTLPEMVERVCQEFEVSSTQALQDIESFLNLMMQEKLVQSVA